MSQVSIAAHGDLFCIHAGKGFSCLGFDVCMELAARYAGALGRPDLMPKAARGTLESYAEYSAALDTMRASGKRFDCDLSPQLIGLEGRRVEVVDNYGERRRFIVGKSTGFIPIHLEIARRDSSGGGGADRTYRSVRVVG